MRVPGSDSGTDNFRVGSSDSESLNAQLIERSPSGKIYIFIHGLCILSIAELNTGVTDITSMP